MYSRINLHKETKLSIPSIDPNTCENPLVGYLAILILNEININNNSNSTEYFYISNINKKYDVRIETAKESIKLLKDRSLIVNHNIYITTLKGKAEARLITLDKIDLLKEIILQFKPISKFEAMPYFIFYYYIYRDNLRSKEGLIKSKALEGYTDKTLEKYIDQSINDLIAKLYIVEKRNLSLNLSIFTFDITEKGKKFLEQLPHKILLDNREKFQKFFGKTCGVGGNNIQNFMAHFLQAQNSENLNSNVIDLTTPDNISNNQNEEAATNQINQQEPPQPTIIIELVNYQKGDRILGIANHILGHLQNNKGMIMISDLEKIFNIYHQKEIKNALFILSVNNLISVRRWSSLNGNGQSIQIKEKGKQTIGLKGIKEVTNKNSPNENTELLNQILKL